ncbi:hypothetical protein ACFLW7_03640 [Chloroflexota bacterium]
MKRLVTIGTPAILPVGLVLFDLSDTDISVADTSIPDNKQLPAKLKQAIPLQLL